MDDKQKINCTVHNCKYNDYENRECVLKSIVVEPCAKSNDNSLEDQSMCGSFAHEKTNQ